MAGKVLPKLKIFLFLSFICMIINIGVCIVAFADTSSENVDYFISTDNYDYQGNIEDEGTNISVFNFVGGMGTSFIPFASIVSVSFLGLDWVTYTFAILIIGIIGALQAFMLVLIGLCFVPNVLGSGMDV
jgi:hypothetical protein